VAESGVWHSLTADQVAAALAVDPQAGLEPGDAERRLAVTGANELPEPPRPGLVARILEQLKGFVVLLLIAASIVSALLGDTVEAAAIMAIVVLNAVLGVVQEGKAEESLASLRRMAAPEARVVRGGRRLTLPARALAPGDLVLLEAGNHVPADLRLIESVNLRIDEAALTGESVSTHKAAAGVHPADTGLGDRHNCAFMGTTVSYGRGRGLVVGTGLATQIGRIAEMISSAGEEETPLQRKLDDLGRTLGIACIAICALVFAIAAVRDTDPGLIVLPGGGILAYLGTFKETLVDVFIVAVSLAIAAVPEGLPAIVTICLALGMREMVRRHALIRKLPAVETLGSATTICSDKTGTLTQNEMTVVRLHADGRAVDVSGGGYEASGGFSEAGAPVDVAADPVLRMLLAGGALCNDAVLEPGPQGHGTRMVGDPTEGALVVAAAKAGFDREGLEKLLPRAAEVPFDAERKRMCTIHRAGGPGAAACLAPGIDGALLAVVKGAPDLVLALCTRVLGSGGPAPLDAAGRAAILAANAALAGDALRVLAVAVRPLDGEPPAEPDAGRLETDLVFVGLAGMIDPARPEVAPAIERARRAGIRTAMITGDYADTARAIAAQIGLLRPGAGVVTGAEIQAMSDGELAERVNSTDVFARVSPEHKVRIVEALRSRGEVVAMTGDGVNDAPALKRSDIGVAMGITGTDVSKQTADMVLTDDNYVSIVSAVEQGRIIYSNIRKFVYFLLSCNLAEIAIIFIGTLLGWPVPLAAIQLLWLNLLSDGAPALALGLEKGDPDIMDRPPRPPREPVINRGMIGGILTQTVALTTVVLVAYWQGMLRFAGLEHTGEVATARTMAFATLVLAELGRVYTCRSERTPLLRLGVFSNRWMQYAVGLSLVLLVAVIALPFLRPVFETVPLSPREWGLVLALAAIPAIVAELQKGWAAALERRGDGAGVTGPRAARRRR
jgi:P-type Ca2+ transporter type 2C